MSIKERSIPSITRITFDVRHWRESRVLKDRELIARFNDFYQKTERNSNNARRIGGTYYPIHSARAFEFSDGEGLLVLALHSFKSERNRFLVSADTTAMGICGLDKYDVSITIPESEQLVKRAKESGQLTSIHKIYEGKLTSRYIDEHEGIVVFVHTPHMKPSAMFINTYAESLPYPNESSPEKPLNLN